MHNSSSFCHRHAFSKTKVRSCKGFELFRIVKKSSNSRRGSPKKCARKALEWFLRHLARNCKKGTFLTAKPGPVCLLDVAAMQNHPPTQPHKARLHAISPLPAVNTLKGGNLQTAHRIMGSLRQSIGPAWPPVILEYTTLENQRPKKFAVHIERGHVCARQFLLRTLVPKKGVHCCLLYTSPSPRDKRQSRMPSSA